MENENVNTENTIDETITDEDEIVLDPNAGVTRTYDYLPYSPATIKAYLREAGYEIEWVCEYKGGRYPGYKREYDVIHIATRKVVQHRVTLDDLRRVLAQAGCPMPPPPRHSGALRFLKAVAEATGLPANEVKKIK